MEKHVVSKMEGIGQAVVAELPRTGHSWHNVHLFVKGHQAAKELVASPDVRQVLGIDRVEGNDARRLIVFEDGKALVGILIQTKQGHRGVGR